MRRYTKEVLTEAVIASTSMAGVMRYFGFKHISGSTHSYLSRLIKQHNICTSHFVHSRGYTGERKRCASDILVRRAAGARQKTKDLRWALLQIGRKEVCTDCGQLPEWNGKPLVLQIDHENGNILDDRSGNLRFLCPNCHTQTPNYSKSKVEPRHPRRSCSGCQSKLGYRNKSGYCAKCRPRHGGVFSNQVSGRECRYCGNPVSRRAKNDCCRGCHNHHVSWTTNRARMIVELGVEYGITDDKPDVVLSGLVWRIPATTIASHLGVSDKAIGKWCRKLGIDKPKPGHWVRNPTGETSLS